jgi:hypothetical protein
VPTVKQAVGVLSCLGGKLKRCYAAQFGQFFQGMPNHRRVIGPLASEGVRRQIGAIGFY